MRNPNLRRAIAGALWISAASLLLAAVGCSSDTPTGPGDDDSHHYQPQKTVSIGPGRSPEHISDPLCDPEDGCDGR